MGDEMAELAMQQTLDRRLVAHRTVAWQHGVVGGIVAGAVMALFLMTWMAISGEGLLRPFELIGSVWYGEFTTGGWAVALGVATHLAVSAALGALWAYVFSWFKLEPLVSGLVYGAIVWAVMALLVLPMSSFLLNESSNYDSFFFGDTVFRVFNPGWADGFGFWTVLAAYLLFGLSLGAFEEYADRRRASRMA
jgi:hypothetical protein